MPACTVKAEHVARWQSELLKGGLASGTVARMFDRFQNPRLPSGVPERRGR